MGPHPLERFIDEMFDLDSFIHCALEGIGYATVAEKVTEAIRKIATSGGSFHPLADDKVYEDRKRHYSKLSAFAKKELEDGHPYLISIASVKVWSILEAGAEQLVAELINDKKRLESCEVIRKLKGPLMDFVEATEEERVSYLKDRLLQDIGITLKIGVGRFEAPLEVLGLGGKVSDIVKKSLLELCEVRNVIVHRGGRVDAKLLSRCPWLPIKQGQSIHLRMSDYYLYTGAAYWYLLELGQRWIEVYDQSHTRAPDATELQDDLTRGISANFEHRYGAS